MASPETNHDDFVGKQKVIYERDFRGAEARITKEGILPHPSLSGLLWGYGILLRYEGPIIDVVTEASSRVDSEVSGVLYDKENIHTTLRDEIMDGPFAPDKGHISKLCLAVKEAREELTPLPLIRFGKFLYNQTGVIASGIPEQAFIELVHSIKQKITAQGMSYKMPWGSHISTSRFKQRRTPDELGGFLKLMSGLGNIGTHRAERIDVITYTQDERGLLFDVQEEFS